MKRCSQCMRMRCSTSGQPSTPCPALKKHEEEQKCQEQGRIQAISLMDSIAADWPSDRPAGETAAEEVDDLLNAYVERGPAPPDGGVDPASSGRQVRGRLLGP